MASLGDFLVQEAVLCFHSGSKLRAYCRMSGPTVDLIMLHTWLLHSSMKSPHSQNCYNTEIFLYVCTGFSWTVCLSGLITCFQEQSPHIALARNEKGNGEKGGLGSKGRVTWF